MYSVLSTKISNYLARELNYDEEQKLILAYSVYNILMTIVGFTTILVLAYLLGALYETFFAVVSGGLLRKFSGGKHCSTPFRCIVAGTITYLAIGWLVKYIFILNININFIHVLSLCLICLLIVVKQAPIDSKAKPIISQEFKKKLHLLSVVTVIIFSTVVLFYYRSSLGIAILGGMFFQSLTLLKTS